MVDVHARYIRSLEQAGKLDRELEFLPSDETLAERKAAGGGLTAPEFAILLSYTKIAGYDELLASDVPEDPYLAGELERYFPTVLRERFRDWMARHRLRREIVASQVTNAVVNHGGTTFVFRLGEETGATPAEVARAFAAAREIFDLPSLWADIESLDGKVDAAVQLSMTLKARTLLERSTRWLLRNRPRPLDIAATIERFRPGAAVLEEGVAELLAGADREAARTLVAELEAAGVPTALAARAAHVQALFAVLDVVDIAAETGLSVRDVASVYFQLADRLELHWLRERIGALPREARWDALARRALAEDLGREHRWLVHDVVVEGGAKTSTGELVTHWTSVNAAAVDRWLHLLAEIRAGGVYDLATLSVAVREIRNLIQATPTAAAPTEPL
jgi:glutamate dehydrogenase